MTQTLEQLASGLTPLITVSPAADAVTFYKDAFGAEELYRLTDPADGRIGHAELVIGGTLLMLADEYPEAAALSPKSLKGSPVRLHIRVDDADAAVDKAVAAGAELIMPVATQFYGDKAGNVRDPFGYVWMLSQHIETVAPDEMQRRWDEMVK